MKKLIININNSLFAQATQASLLKTGDFMVERVLSYKSEDISEACFAFGADILFMDVSRNPSCVLEKRIETIIMAKKRLSKLKIALFCDSNSDPDIAERVKSEKAIGQIDVFFYESVKENYLVDALDSL